MEKFADLTEFTQAVGRELGPTRWVEITQARIDMFADATDDHQWIHTDPSRAADGPFGGTIAHGLLTLSLLPRFMTEQYSIDSVTTAINYGFNKIRFISPVRAGARVRGRSRIAEITTAGEALQATMTTTIEVEGIDKPAAVIESIVRYQT